jgi:hypothetical protein
MNMFNEQLAKKNVNFDSCMENTVGILQAKRALQIVSEKDAFAFLLYQIHLKNVKDHELKQMNSTFETHHPAFDVKTAAKFSINQVQRMTLKFSEKCEFKPFTFFGLASDPQGSDIKYYPHSELCRKSIELNRAHYYTFYPVKRQIAISFGEERRNRGGLTQTFDTPQMVLSTQNIKPVAVKCAKNHTMILTKEG